MNKLAIPILAVSLSLNLPPAAFGQGTFENLNFESANVPDVPAGQDGGIVSATNAIPGWTVYVGNSPVGWVYHNTFVLGGSATILWGPVLPQSEGIQGNYFVGVMSGYSASSANSTTAIGQVGQIPSMAQSVFFYGRTGGTGTLRLTFGGSDIPYYLVGSTPNYEMYQGDVSAFAGLTGELRFTAYPLSPSGFGGGAVDAVSFSSQPIPEPSTFALFALGGLLLGWRFRRKEMKSSNQTMDRMRGSAATSLLQVKIMNALPLIGHLTSEVIRQRFF